MHKILYAIASLFLLLAACLTEADPVLFLAFDTPLPSTTTAAEVIVHGNVLRSPAKLNTTKVVTATGGAETVVDTTDSFGIFEMTLRLNPGVNLVIFVAEDDSGARSSRIQWEVLQQAAS